MLGRPGQGHLPVHILQVNQPHGAARSQLLLVPVAAAVRHARCEQRVVGWPAHMLRARWPCLARSVGGMSGEKKRSLHASTEVAKDLATKPQVTWRSTKTAHSDNSGARLECAART